MPVKIHGKEYMTVAERITLLHKNEKNPFSILTELVSWENGIVIMKATLIIKVLNPEGDFLLDRCFNGYAYESESASMINKTSALENAETSAIGRALASAGYLGTEFCSADELANAITNQNTKKTYEKVSKTPKKQNDVQSPFPADNAPKYNINDDVITFGKHKGTPWLDVDTKYLEWLSKNNERYKDKALATLEAKESKSEAQQSIKDIADVFDSKPETFTDDIPF